MIVPGEPASMYMNNQDRDSILLNCDGPITPHALPGKMYITQNTTTWTTKYNIHMST